MNIKSYLKKWKKKVDEKLIEYLPLEETYPQTLNKAMRYTVLAGGKRIRPILMITTYHLTGGRDVEKIMPVACAIEFIHSYSLIHDDLPAIDNDNYRRGLPSSHIKFGEDIAILAGDGLFSHAFYIISESNLAAIEKEKVLKVLTKALGNEGIIGGQVKDVESNCSMKDPKLLRYIHSHKTACFFSAACEIGGVLAGAEEEKLFSLRKGGLFMGMAFQIVDDLLDVKTKMKEAGRDENKLTYPSVHGIEYSRKIAGRYSELCLEYLKPIDEEGILEKIILLLLGRKN